MTADARLSCPQGFKRRLLSQERVQQFLVSTLPSKTDSSPPAPRKLALAIQGTASDIPTVRAILARMETRSRVDVFYLAWGVSGPRAVMAAVPVLAESLQLYSCWK